MTTSDTNVSTPSPARLAEAARNLLNATENAATRGDFELARVYALKAMEAIRALREVAPRRVTKAESQHGRLM
jgi:hypothetical protein